MAAVLTRVNFSASLCSLSPTVNSREGAEPGLEPLTLSLPRVRFVVERF